VVPLVLIFGMLYFTFGSVGPAALHVLFAAVGGILALALRGLSFPNLGGHRPGTDPSTTKHPVRHYDPYSSASRGRRRRRQDVDPQPETAGAQAASRPDTAAARSKSGASAVRSAACCS